MAAKPATTEKTYIIPLTETDIVRVIRSLAADVSALELLASADPGDPSDNVAAALAEASEALRARFADVVRPEPGAPARRLSN